ncbi:FKBP-type peptidyl-prolyl cis-trans isomerase [Dactylosporangium sp. NPDC051484]|uniref:FKBP-type peptidyl-prolyl cis-trans isomerase n=1 Tax=Dactylosporangium sp. NPDC051484 TaxID=3154942 RepID=UPI00344C74FD
MNDRASQQRPAAPNRPGTGPDLPSKAEKRTAAKAAKARAAAAAKRRQVLTVAAAAAAVVAVITVVVVLAVRRDDPAATAQSGAGAVPSGAAASVDVTAEATRPAFPPVPADADPALSTKPAAKAGSGSVSQLAVTTLIEGKGAATQAGQTITVNYVGVTFADGKEFDSSWRRSQPFSFPLGGGRVIRGWDQGLLGVKVGSRVQLDIPPALAYGEHPAGGAPGGTLRFIVDVLSAA